jgi:hypothetical protein
MSSHSSAVATDARNQGPTRFRRGLQSSAGHTEVQSPRKSAGKKIVANDESYALAA